MTQAKAETRYTDEDRERLARRIEHPHGAKMIGPDEQSRCPHGRFFTYRWVWNAGDSIGNAEPSGACACSKCMEDYLND